MSTQKTVLYVRTDIYNKPLIAGGSVSHTLGVIEGFLEHDYSVICASSIMQEILQKLSLTKLVSLQNPRWMNFLRWRLNCLLSNIFFTKKILDLCKKFKPIMIYQRYSLLNASGIIASRLTKIPLILEYNGSEVWIDKHWGKKSFFKLRRLAGFIETINLRKAHRIIVVSQALKDELEKRRIIPEKIIVNPNGVNTDLYNSEKLTGERNTIRQALNIDDKFVVGFVGTFSPWHGIELLAKTIPIILQQNPSVHFLLIGEGPLLPMLRKVVHEQPDIGTHVTFTGLLPSEQTRHHLAACDAFISPNQPNPDGSPFFGSPTKIFEYLSLGKPIIASEIGQVGDLVQPAIRIKDIQSPVVIENQLGFLISPNNTQEFIQAINLLTALDKKVVNIMGNNARTKAVHNYRWYDQVNKIIQAC